MKKIIFIILLLFSGATIFAQSVVVKKADGSYEEIAITNSVEFTFIHPCPGIPTITDSRDNKIYKTVQIGNQCWLKENLNVGTMINNLTG